MTGYVTRKILKKMRRKYDVVYADASGVEKDATVEVMCDNGWWGLRGDFVVTRPRASAKLAATDCVDGTVLSIVPHGLLAYEELAELASMVPRSSLGWSKTKLGAFSKLWDEWKS